MLDQGGAPIGVHVEQASVFLAQHEHVEQQPPLRRQQGGEAKPSGAEALDVIGEEPLQEASPVGSADPD